MQLNTQNSKLKILITGAAGFIGSKLSEELIARGDNVVGIYILNTDSTCKCKNIFYKKL